MAQYRTLVRQGIWDNNVVFGQMLSLCPTLAVTSSATNGLGMGMATLAVVTMSNILVSALKRFITPEVRIPAFVLIIATLVTIVDMAMNAWVHELYKVLGLFIPLIVVNCLILGRAESFAAKNSVVASAVDGIAMGIGFTLALVVLGGVREVLGTGTLFANASGLLGPAFTFLELKLVPADYPGVLVAILPPGGFIGLGLLIAGKRLIDRRAAKAAATGAACHAAE
ncbi:MAG TPA: electron transport complex subunit E [Candidatus Omnitrophota bacterium]|nr:electron transport complex subunit E [Candidatus Omnitrophota bacterium]